MTPRAAPRGASSRSSRARASSTSTRAATSQTPLPVIEAMDALLPRATGRPSTAASTRSPREATEAYEGARAKVAAFAGSTAGETVFTRNATEAINLVAYSWGRANVRAGDLVVVTRDGAPLQPRAVAAARQRDGRRARLRRRSTTRACSTSTRSTRCSRAGRSSSRSRTSPTCSARSTRSPRSPAARTPPARSCRSTARRPCRTCRVDVARARRRLLRLDRHKAYGPTGIGVLHGRRELLEAMPPFIGGGHMISRVDELESTWAEPPAKFEAGTIADRRGDRARRRRRLPRRASAWTRCGSTRSDVVGYALERLAEVPGSRSTARATSRPRGAVVSFALEGVHPHDVAEILGREGVCVRAGHHCAQPLMRRLGVAGDVARHLRDPLHARGRRPAGRRASAQVRRCSPDGRPLPRADPRALQAAAPLGRAGATPDLEFEDNNPLCGDELKVQIKVDGDGKIADLRFSGHGCAISQAAASMASDEVIGHAGRRAAAARPRASCSTCWGSTSRPRA